MLHFLVFQLPEIPSWTCSPVLSIDVAFPGILLASNSRNFFRTGTGVTAHNDTKSKSGRKGRSVKHATAQKIENLPTVVLLLFLACIVLHW